MELNKITSSQLLEFFVSTIDGDDNVVFTITDEEIWNREIMNINHINSSKPNPNQKQQYVTTKFNDMYMSLRFIKRMGYAHRGEDDQTTYFFCYIDFLKDISHIVPNKKFILIERVDIHDIVPDYKTYSGIIENMIYRTNKKENLIGNIDINGMLVSEIRKKKITKYNKQEDEV